MSSSRHKHGTSERSEHEHFDFPFLELPNELQVIVFKHLCITLNSGVPSNPFASSDRKMSPFIRDIVSMLSANKACYQKLGPIWYQLAMFSCLDWQFRWVRKLESPSALQLCVQNLRKLRVVVTGRIWPSPDQDWFDIGPPDDEDHGKRGQVIKLLKAISER